MSGRDSTDEGLSTWHGTIAVGAIGIAAALLIYGLVRIFTPEPATLQRTEDYAGWEFAAPSLGQHALYRTAVPGGWLYVIGDTATFVPAIEEEPR